MPLEQVGEAAERGIQTAFGQWCCSWRNKIFQSAN
jgi:hypothetical protein